MSPPEGLRIEPRHWEIVASALARHLGGIEVWAFGSRVTGTERRFSDLDLAVVSSEPLPLPVRSALHEELEESELPFRVDVVDLVSASAGFRAVVERRHLVLQRA